MSREHKDVSLKWLSTLPIDWTSLKAKYCGSFSGNGVDKKIRDNEDLYKSVHYMDVYRNSLNELCYSDSFLTVSADKNKANISKLKKGDILITNSSETPEDMGHSTMIGEGFEDTLQGYHLMRFRPKQILDSHYLLFYLGSHLCRSWFSLMSTGITRYGVSKSAFTELPILVPSFETQRKIAGLLDVKINTINSIERQTKSTIEDYKLLKQSIITEAVTKGLDKNVEMKESGVVWIGQIPKHWEMKASGSIFSNSKDRAEISDEKLSSTQSHGVVPQSLFEEAEGRQVVSVNKNYELLKKVKKNTFVISLRSFQGGIEMSRYDGAISAAYTILIPSNEVNTEYFRFLFKSSAYIQAIQSTIIESVREGKSVSYSDFKTIKLPIFDYNEQAEIAMYLEKRTHEIDSLIAKKEHLISDLEAYKKSLIYEYVTGKKEVE